VNRKEEGDRKFKNHKKFSSLPSIPPSKPYSQIEEKKKNSADA